MTIIRFIGDVHGKMDVYRNLVENCEHSTIQVGDMGVGFIPDSHIISVTNMGDHQFIRGNHDNPFKCKNIKGYISDGEVKRIGNSTVMFIGGAKSIDAHDRIEGVSWWREEELTYADWGVIMGVYERVKPDILVTHDCGQSVAGNLFGENRTKYNNKSITAQALDHMLDIHSPKCHIFGHWHESKIMQIGRTQYFCVDKESYMDIEL